MYIFTHSKPKLFTMIYNACWPSGTLRVAVLKAYWTNIDFLDIQVWSFFVQLILKDPNRQNWGKERKKTMK
jgi:hypothetical protein